MRKPTQLLMRSIAALALVVLLATSVLPVVSFAQNFPYDLSGTGATTGSADPVLGIDAGLQQVETGNILPQGVQTEPSVSRLALLWVGYALTFYTVVAVLMLIYFGVRLVISFGNAEERKKAMSAIINLILGTMIIYFSYWIVDFVISLTEVGTDNQAVQSTLTNPPRPNF